MYSERNYKGWQSVVLTSGEAEIVIPQEIGPRVISCGLKGGDNLFYTVKEELGQSGESDWRLRGGHRLWHAPEQMPRSYDPDNFPIRIEKSADGSCVTFSAPEADPALLHKSIRIEALGNETFKLTHRITNCSPWPVTFAPWAVSVLTRGGIATVPFLPKGQHPRDLLPDNQLVSWPYTDLSLPQWQFRRDYLGIDTATAEIAQKIGLSNYANWAAYWQQGGTFVKSARVAPNAPYPDRGSALEIFLNESIIELETLAPLQEAQPQQTLEHTEYWGVLKDLPRPDSDHAFNGHYRKAIDKWYSDNVSST